MKYTVVTSPVAEDYLARIWLAAPDKQRVTDAFDYMEGKLKYNPEAVGRLHPDGWRIFVVAPLVITFRIKEADRVVRILSVEYVPPPE